MRQIVSRLASTIIFAFAVSGCATQQSAFNYAEEASDTAALVVPKPLRVLNLDGKVVSLPMFLEYPYTLTLAAGEHTIQFQYGESWGKGRANELVRGPVMGLEFTMLSGRRYEIDFARPESVRNRDLAESYLSAFNAWLLDGQGGRVEARSTGSAGSLVRSLAALGNSSEAAQNGSASSASSLEPAPGSRLQALQQLWQDASDDEKKTFMQWVVAPGS